MRGALAGVLAWAAAAAEPVVAGAGAGVAPDPGAAVGVCAMASGASDDSVGAEVAFAGRSNAGKPSAINAITQRHGLARTSKTPGRTRLLNYFELAPARRLVDLPGYGYASVAAAERGAWLPLLEGRS